MVNGLKNIDEDQMEGDSLESPEGNNGQPLTVTRYRSLTPMNDKNNEDG